MINIYSKCVITNDERLDFLGDFLRKCCTITHHSHEMMEGKYWVDVVYDYVDYEEYEDEYHIPDYFSVHACFSYDPSKLRALMVSDTQLIVKDSEGNDILYYTESNLFGIFQIIDDTAVSNFVKMLKDSYNRVERSHKHKLIKGGKENE